MARSAAAAAFLLASLGPVAARAEPVRATVEQGVLVGEAEGGVSAYKGVPFAAPPIGALRWAPPAPARAWGGDRPALAYGPACPQPMPADGRPNPGGARGPVSEDCLSLNVFAPQAMRHAPVMVWIYGGANQFGSNAVPAYDGGSFARDGVILVSVNYRLGALGFFAHPALTRAAGKEALANYALMDQIAALKWVRRNIAAFGGDPSNVTLFGESAGGVDALALMTAPEARGLFSRVIIESGGGWSEPIDMPAAERQGQALAEKAGLSADATVEELRALPAAALANLDGRFGPIIDGRILPQGVTRAFARHEEAPLPLIIGSNSFEASLMASFGLAANAVLGVAPPTLLAAYADEPTPQDKAFALFTDGVMGGPARWIAQIQSRSAPAWLYYFSFRRAVYAGRYPGAPHASEIPFVFDSWTKIDAGLSHGAATPEDLALTKLMHACWVAFAKFGSPNCPTPEPWPRVDATKAPLMVFDDPPKALPELKKARLDAQEAAHARLLSTP